MNDVVRVEREGATVVLYIAHPPANAISQAVRESLSEALSDAEADDTCRVAIITGEGSKFFGAGADISEFESLGAARIANGQQLTLQMEASRLPMIAAVNGIALGGGCELALACDIRIASDTARFGQPEVKLGIIAGWGGSQRLPQLIGRGRALEMLLTGEPVDAHRAHAIGLVNHVVAAESLMATARALADQIAAQAPLAVAASKRAVIDGSGQPLKRGMAVERKGFVTTFDTDDARAAVAAFLNKAPTPPWTGR